MLVKETRDLLLTARVLGHSHERVTEIYAHLLPGHLDRAKDAFVVAASATPAEQRAKAAWGTVGVAKGGGD